MNHPKTLLLVGSFILYTFLLPAQNFLGILNEDFASAKERAKAVLQQSEFSSGMGILTTNTMCNPLLLDNQPLDYGYFSIVSKGILSVLEGESCNQKTESIPFRLHIRRATAYGEDNQIIFTTGTVKQIEIREVLRNAQIGDELIIEPIYNENWRSKRVLKLLKPFDDC